MHSYTAPNASNCGMQIMVCCMPLAPEFAFVDETVFLSFESIQIYIPRAPQFTFVDASFLSFESMIHIISPSLFYQVMFHVELLHPAFGVIQIIHFRIITSF